MAQSDHSRTNEKRVLAIGGIVILLIIAVIAYFEWTGRHIY
jgi:hypothetical protein